MKPLRHPQTEHLISRGTRVARATVPALLVLILAAGVAVAACDRGTDATGLQIAHPDDPSKQVEYFVERPAGLGPWATVVFLHGHQTGPFSAGGKAFVDWGVLRRFAQRGYLAVAVSQPGYGGSSGPADFCGPFTQHAVAAVIETLRAEGLAAPSRVVIQGVSRGALTAGLVAAHDPTISAVVLISGVYDLAEYVEQSRSNAAERGVVRALMAETGGTDEALRSRSLLHYAGQIRAATLILSGSLDDRTDAGQAQRLAAAIVASGGKARAIIYPSYGHQIPVDVRSQDIDPFINDVLQRERF